MKGKKAYFRRIEIIRDISCILVLLYHLNIIRGGFLTVCTFFTLSGYLTSMSALKKEAFSIKEYYINRVKKLYFPLIVVVSITVIIAKIIPTINWINLKPETISVVFGYNNFWQLKANFDYFSRNTNSPFIHLWYISILLQFDLFFPIMFSLLKKFEEKVQKNIATIVVILFTIATTIAFFYMSKTKDIMVVYYNTFARSFSFFFGILLAIEQYKHNFEASKLCLKFNTILFVIYNIALILLCIFIPIETKNYAIYMILVTIISTRLIKYSTIQNDKIQKFDIHIKILSKISCEIYLVQYPIIFFMQNILMNNILKMVLIVIFTYIISFILCILIKIPLHNKKIKNIKNIILCIVILLSGFIVITEKNHTAEMKELENKLSENLKIIEEKSNEYINAENTEREEWNKILENMGNEEENIAETIKKLPIVGVGDSVLLGVINELYKTFPNGYFDGKISRTIFNAEDILKDLKNKGKLGDTLILCLATNGDYSDKRNKELMEIVENREVYWVNAVGADDPNFNDRFKKFASNYTNIHIVEWDKAAKNHPEYFYADGIHVKDTGIKVYVKTIYESLYNNYLEKNRIKNNTIMQKHEGELKNKITFYGNDVLTNAFDKLNKKIPNANFNAKTDYTFENLYEEIKYKVDNKILEHKIVLLFDKKANISESEYKMIIDLCKDYKIYIFNLTNKKYSFQNENVKIIDFYNEIKSNKDYTFADNVHLSEAGNEALVDLIVNTIELKNS